MEELVKVLKRKPKKEIQYGVVLSVFEGDRRVRVILKNGVKTYIRYPASLGTLTVGDRVLVNGDNFKSIVNIVGQLIPRSHATVKV